MQPKVEISFKKTNSDGVLNTVKTFTYFHLNEMYQANMCQRDSLPWRSTYRKLRSHHVYTCRNIVLIQNYMLNLTHAYKQVRSSFICFKFTQFSDYILLGLFLQLFHPSSHFSHIVIGLNFRHQDANQLENNYIIYLFTLLPNDAVCLAWLRIKRNRRHTKSLSEESVVDFQQNYMPIWYIVLVACR